MATIAFERTAHEPSAALGGDPSITSQKRNSRTFRRTSEAPNER